MHIDNFENSLDEDERNIWNTEAIFKPLSAWSDEDGLALFFRLGSNEPPEVTSPEATSFDFKYFTHWMALPKELYLAKAYRVACIKSGIKVTNG
ncbi:hypothetical protein [Photobacterium kishitanii]|uniref:Uncharacterized protein n=1 Tax=Photobacterium kishitanii TaxID=318456 RepID=A0A2T3KKZ4_9GAMM|nr:hypothetical protein [Photobacterium kishitanii]PSV00323.1 hypothetical protein C9J27_04145 [Photobacterium kishitanii]